MGDGSRRAPRIPCKEKAEKVIRIKYGTSITSQFRKVNRVPKNLYLESMNAFVMKQVLDERRLKRIRSAVLRYSKIDIAKHGVTFYSYPRKERGDSESFDFAWYDPDDGSINVEVPSIDKIKAGACLAFLFLHELAHVDGVENEDAATNLAAESLTEAKVLPQDRIQQMRRGWKIAHDDDEALGEEVKKILLRRGIISKGIRFSVMSEIYDEARISLLCGRRGEARDKV